VGFAWNWKRSLIFPSLTCHFYCQIALAATTHQEVTSLSGGGIKMKKLAGWLAGWQAGFISSRTLI